MGFGALFIGYFLLLNITYYGVTDCLAALIMLLGLYRLSAVNRHFKAAAVGAAVLAVFGLGELVLSAMEMLNILSLDPAASYISMARSIILCVLSAFILLGITEVSREVELERIPERCRVLLCATFIVYGLWVLLEAPLPNWLPDAVSGVLYLLAIISLLVLLIANLVTIWSCYMRICMPGDERGRQKKPSRFGFVNEYRRRREEKEREEAEYRASQLEKRRQRRKKK